MEDLSYRGAMVMPLPMVHLRRCHNPEKALVVYQNAKGKGEAAVQELLARARIIVPALMNYLFFSSTHVAVLYLGKKVVDGKKLGVEEGAVDMKIRMLRYLTTDMWPPLLRTDAPEDSGMAEFPFSSYGESLLEDLPPGEAKLGNVCRETSIKFLRLVALQRSMEVLVYVKNGVAGMKYLKLILRNTMERVHFDVIDTRDEKHRWEERKLFVRILDNLETQRAIPSFEAYESYFREACTVAARLSVHHAILKKRVVVVDSRSGGGKEDAGEERQHSWMAKLSKPEGSMLDYKSYIFDTVAEIKYNCIRFMCGFLNAYMEGKLVIGVHEVPRRNPDGSIPPFGDGKNSIIRHDDLVDQYVVGVCLTAADLEDIQQSLSQQLLECVPPVPPEAVRVVVLPVQFPKNFKISSRVLVLCDNEANGYGNAIKQKIFCALHHLVPQGLALVVVRSQTLQQAFLQDGECFHKHKIGFYGVAAVQEPLLLDRLKWEESLSYVLEGQKSCCRFVFVDAPGDIEVVSLGVVEVSVNLKRTACLPLRMYTGKFFSGWPSIPIWDTVTQTVRCVERNYNVFASLLGATGGSVPKFHKRNSTALAVPLPVRFSLPSEPSQRWALRHSLHSWFSDPQVAGRVLSFLGDTLDSLRFRLLHPVCDTVFERRQGIHLLQLLFATSLGDVSMRCSWDALSWMQSEMREAEIPPMPLLLCRVFESIGTLPSPFPYVAVPLEQQSFRVSKYLVPLFNLQSYFDGQMRPSIVLDMRDGIVKAIRLQNGIFILQRVFGVGFEQITRRHLSQFLYRRRMSEEGRFSDEDALISDTIQGFLTPSLFRPFMHASDEEQALLLPLAAAVEDTGIQTLPREMERRLPLLAFKFLTEDTLPKCGVSSSTAPQSDGGTEVEHEQADVRRIPWTLSHLLAWFNVLASDEHVQHFGYCRRSVAFRISSLREVCSEHVDRIEEGNAFLSRLRFADSPQSCLLHQVVDAWLSL
ncbi:uncharacterized protein Tco025E_08345 [Trypanosoma conorhini]|uniref:Uncharacterized protein n=1 Tax=Trypanosoma conorhini TaxID=83891 RepID=A0A3R7N9D8_9TRYP|nr:uncharacterized protein Tco025E_08345 [Trypanosoma conorhini]RNF02646.1 hypothetical protein Tco025E_08345 [Trypanosoma conorhini]